jgi:hypothetical protein
VRTLASFPSYKLLEKSSPDSFEASIKENPRNGGFDRDYETKETGELRKKECDVCRIRPSEDHIVG